MRIPVVAALLGLAASCAAPPPEAAAPPPVPPGTAAAPVPLVAPAPPPPSAAAPPPAREIGYEPMPLVWARMLTQPPPAGRLMLSNFSFEPTRIQAGLAAEPVCAIDNPAALIEFTLPPNGTRVLPAPPGTDICWRRELMKGDPKQAGKWTAWNRAFTGPGRFLDAVVVTPEPLPAIAAPVGPEPALPSTMAPAFPMPALPPG